ncbi:MAG: hypothetical protein FWD72_01170 [Eggerthellaceae bacterium]|nr:hypothetical protein [Eggerthellaceae bacterium]
MELQAIENDFSVCKIDNVEQVDFTKEFVFLSKTPDEVSLVCESACVPLGARAVEAGWKALRVCGVLDFSLIGGLQKLRPCWQRKRSAYLSSQPMTPIMFS